MKYMLRNSCNSRESSSLTNKKEKAITLIALVITIIVLLILAGVTIATLTGKDGMLSKAENSKNENAKAQIFEEFKMIIVEIEIKYKGNATIQDIVTELGQDSKNEYIIELPESSSIIGEIPDVSNVEKINVIYKNYKFEVNKNLQVGIVDSFEQQNEEQISQVTIMFNANEGSISGGNESISLSIGAKYGQLPTAIREGYSFTGWYTENINGTEVTSETIVSSTDNQTLYAHWTANTYVIAFYKNAEDATGIMSNQNFTYGTAQNLTANAFERTGYTFLGWNTDSEATTATYVDEQNVNNLTQANNETITLYAIWKDKITISDYGKLVNDYRASGETSLQWRVFYHDSNYVYIISATATEYSYNPSLYYTTTKPNNPIWTSYCSIWNNNWSTSYDSQKAGAYLMTESNWTKYKDLEGKAAYAFGAPPFEMYINSINATQSKGWTYSWLDYGYTISGIGANGYYTENNTITDTMSNGIYQLNNTNVWLAAPLTTNNSALYLEYYPNLSIDALSITKKCGIRPLIAIPVNNFSYTLS